MVAPLVVGGYVLGAAAISAVSAYFAGDEIINQNQYTTQNTTQIKNNEVIIGSGSKIGELTISDSQTANQTANPTQTAGISSGIDPLLLAGGAAFVAYLIYGGKKK